MTGTRSKTRYAGPHTRWGRGHWPDNVARVGVVMLAPEGDEPAPSNNESFAGRVSIAEGSRDNFFGRN